MDKSKTGTDYGTDYKYPLKQLRRRGGGEGISLESFIAISVATILLWGLLPLATLATEITESHEQEKVLRVTEQAVQPGEVLYLLAFKGVPKCRGRERNFYEFAREIYRFFDPPPPLAGVMTSEEVRYGIFATMKAEVLRVTDSQHAPQSSKESLYVLLYDSIYRFCAKSYTIRMRGSEGVISYRDYLGGTDCEWQIRRRGPFLIYEVRMVTGNIARELWEERRGRPFPPD